MLQVPFVRHKTENVRKIIDFKFIFWSRALSVSANELRIEENFCDFTDLFLKQAKLAKIMESAFVYLKKFDHNHGLKH